MERRHSPICHLANFFEKLNPAALEELDALYSNTIAFSDPINQANGIAQLKTVLVDLFKQLNNIQIEVSNQSGDRQHGFIRWTMSYEFRGKPRSIDGVTFARFDDTGRITKQDDYWDASFPIYGEFPLMGLAMKGIRRLVTVKHAE